MSERPDGPTSTTTPLHAEVGDRFGVLPSFFRLAPETPEVTANLWGFAKFGYLDNPLPPLFKERLFVYLSRFCEARYCIARHVGFLAGLGRPSGDPACPPETVEQVVRLIRRPLPRGDDLEPHLTLLEGCTAPLPSLPESGTPAEEAVFACATHVFLQTPQAAKCFEALRRVLDGVRFQHLLVFLAFVRTAHFWTKVHPELEYEDDIRGLLAVHEALAEGVLNDPEAAACDTAQVLVDELAALRRERTLRQEVEQANKVLLEREEELREAQRVAHVGSWRWDANTDTTTGSDELFRIYGLDPGTQSFPDFEDQDGVLYSHEDWQRVKSAIRQTMQTGVGFELDVQALRNGEPIWITTRSEVVRNVTGEVVGLRGTVQDITGRKRAEAGLRESEVRERQRADELETVLAAVPAVVWIAHDPACRRITGNRAASEFLRLPQDANQSVTAPEGEQPVHFKVMKDGVELRPDQLPVQMAATGREVRDFEEEVVFDDGARFHLFGHAMPLRDDAGRVRGSVAAFVDITERRRAEEAGRKRSEQMRGLANIATRFNAAPDVGSVMRVVAEEARRLIGAHQSVTSFTTDHNLAQAINAVSLSDKYAEWRNYDEQPDGSGIYSLVCHLNRPMRLTQDELDRHPAYKRFGRHAPNHPPLRGWLAAPLVGRDGRNIGLVQLSDRCEGEFTEDDEAVIVQLAQMASVAIENARLVQDLRDADRRKDDFLALLAHELRNPLAPLRSGLQVMRLAGHSREPVEQARTMMERQLTQLVRIVDDLLDVSRVTRNKLELRTERVDLAAVVQSAVESSRPVVEERGHGLTVELPPEPVPLDADLTRLTQVFANLLNNSAKYTPPGGRIRLVAGRQAGEVVVAVQDTGIGIPEAALGRIFDMFSQVDRTLERTTGGLGIGLSLVKGLVEMHGGTVEARSDGEGKGSTFTVRLPVAEDRPHPVPQMSRNGERRPVPKRRVLVVDDNRDSAESLAMLLRLTGNEVRTAHDGLEAVETAGTYRPELILMDVGMPKLNGLDATRRIREQPWGGGVVVVALTGWGQDGDRQRTTDAGCDGHLVKPVDPAALEELLTGLTKQPR